MMRHASTGLHDWRSRRARRRERRHDPYYERHKVIPVAQRTSAGYGSIQMTQLPVFSSSRMRCASASPSRNSRPFSGRVTMDSPPVRRFEPLVGGCWPKWIDVLAEMALASKCLPPSWRGIATQATPSGTPARLLRSIPVQE